MSMATPELLVGFGRLEKVTARNSIIVCEKSRVKIHFPTPKWPFDERPAVGMRLSFEARFEDADTLRARWVAYNLDIEDDEDDIDGVALDSGAAAAPPPAAAVAPLVVTDKSHHKSAAAPAHRGQFPAAAAQTAPVAVAAAAAQRPLAAPASDVDSDNEANEKLRIKVNPLQPVKDDTRELKARENAIKAKLKRVDQEIEATRLAAANATQTQQQQQLLQNEVAQLAQQKRKSGAFQPIGFAPVQKQGKMVAPPKIEDMDIVGWRDSNRSMSKSPAPTKASDASKGPYVQSFVPLSEPNHENARAQQKAADVDDKRQEISEDDSAEDDRSAKKIKKKKKQKKQKKRKQSRQPSSERSEDRSGSESRSASPPVQVKKQRQSHQPSRSRSRSRSAGPLSSGSAPSPAPDDSPIQRQRSASRKSRSRSASGSGATRSRTRSRSASYSSRSRTRSRSRSSRRNIYSSQQRPVYSNQRNRMRGGGGRTMMRHRGANQRGGYNNYGGYPQQYDQHGGGSRGVNMRQVRRVVDRGAEPSGRLEIVARDTRGVTYRPKQAQYLTSQEYQGRRRSSSRSPSRSSQRRGRSPGGGAATTADKNGGAPPITTVSTDANGARQVHNATGPFVPVGFPVAHQQTGGVRPPGVGFGAQPPPPGSTNGV